MDARKKLASLLAEAECKQTETYLQEADYLIARGVTLQEAIEKKAEGEWIPVSEKLPENFVSVLGYMPAAEQFPTVRECYTVGTAFYFPELLKTCTVSHWMPMPQPPKIAGAKSEARCQYLGSGPLEGRCMATRDTDPCIGYGSCLVYKPLPEGETK